MKINGYKIVSEIVSQPNPNVDMLIVKPYLYVYISRDSIDDVKEKGMSTGEDGTIQAFFARLPESKYSDYLSDHVPVKISVAKLKKIKDQKVVIKPVNFKYSKDSLDDDDIQKILDKGSEKILSLMKNEDDITKLPSAKVSFSTGQVPAFVLKVLDVDDKQMTEMSKGLKARAMIAKMMPSGSKAVRKTARDARRNPTTVNWMANMAGTKAPKKMTRQNVGKVMRKFSAASA